MYLASSISYENCCSAKLTYLFYWKEGQCTHIFTFFPTFPPFKELYLRSNPSVDSNKHVGSQICFILKKPEKTIGFWYRILTLHEVKNCIISKICASFILGVWVQTLLREHYFLSSKGLCTHNRMQWRYLLYERYNIEWKWFWTAGIQMKWRCDHRSCNCNLSDCKS